MERIVCELQTLDADLMTIHCSLCGVEIFDIEVSREWRERLDS